jgi:CDP-diacylglycerol--glycerol-3-phosphate 3-phosphatidyltransferase
MPVENTAEQPKTLTAYARYRFRGLLDRTAAFLLRVGLTPNGLTVAGLVGHIAGAILIAQAYLLAGGLVILLTAPFDALDGAMAKQRGDPNPFGGFLDSVTDRYSEIALFIGLLIYFTRLREDWLIGLTIVALAGSMMVSYTRARAEGLGFELKIGLFTRLERYLVIVPTILVGIPWLGVSLLALFANITALQRILFFRKISR